MNVFSIIGVYFLRAKSQLPYGKLEPFGRVDTAQDLTDDSVKEYDAQHVVSNVYQCYY